MNVIRFLTESNKIEGIDEINYENPRFQNPEKGHFGAYTISQQAASEQAPLSVKMLRVWQAMLGKEQQEFSGTAIDDLEIGQIRGPALKKNVRIGTHLPPSYEEVPTFLQYLVEDLNQDLKENRLKYESDPEAFTRFAASYFLRFERIHPFSDGNGRVGRLLANYLAASCKKPLLIFPSDTVMRNIYIKAHNSEDLMTAYFQQIMKETR